MQYTLSPVPVSIATADGSKRVIKKSNLPPIMKDKMIDQDISIIPEINKVSAYILDFIVFLITITDILSTLEDLEWRVKKQIPAGHNWVDIVTHTYRPVSIKMQEQDGRGRSNSIITNSVKSRTPCDFKEFLSNGENKSKLITLIIFEYFVTKNL